MELVKPSKLFGSRRRTATLIAVRMLEETYPSELARLLDARLYSVQTILDALESEGVIVTRRLGRTRRVTLNPRYVAHQQLSDLLWALGTYDVELQTAIARKRGRPRRSRKPGL